MTIRTIKVDHLARVEGEGSLYLRIQGNEVAEARLSIFEPPRFFEALLRGRAYSEAPDITARICGICPVAYQMSAVHAMERAAGVKVSEPLRKLRRLLYCGEWIESHILHIYMLHAPDFLGYQDAIEMARDHTDAVNRGLELKKTGNQLIRLLGGREIHPINIRVGGFYKCPEEKELKALGEKLKWARDAALETVRWVSGFPFPEYRRDYEFVALRHSSNYPINEGRIVSSKGVDIDACEFEDTFEERQVPHSNALHAFVKGRGAYFVGPMARYNLNFTKLPELARSAAKEAGLGEHCDNPFQSIIIRAIEAVFACDEALTLIEEYEPPEEPAIDVLPRGKTGWACTEAPRGILYHRYQMDANGDIIAASIIPPTSQNQKTIEDDLCAMAADNLDLDDEALQWRCEQTIRNYDPCISCATHFLNLEVERR